MRARPLAALAIAMSLYVIVLFTHSYLRWILILAVAGLLVRSLNGWLGGRLWTPVDETLHKAVLGLTDLQFLLGLALYVGLSPVARAFWSSPGLGMKTAALRFFGVEHVFSMLIAIAVLHVGRARSKRALEVRQRQRVVFVSLVAAFVLFLVSTPWPFLPYGRPLVRTASAALEQRLQRPAMDGARAAVECSGDLRRSAQSHAQAF
jgi:hypothetical protein